MKKINSFNLLCAVALLPFPMTMAGPFTFTNLTSDEDTGLSPTKTYTHMVDFGADATAATINGVHFTSKGKSGSNYTLTNTGGSFVNNTQGNLADGLGDLFSDFFYGGDANGVQTLTLTGLREAHTYRTTFFVAGWGGANEDVQGSDSPADITRMSRAGTSAGPTGDVAGTLEPTAAGSPGAAISYEFVAPASGTLVFTFDAVNNGDTFHHYGFVNELIALPGDTDGDGVPDIYEKANGLNPAVKDADLDLDNDGVKNLDEYKLGTAANNPDTDGDGLKDGVETGTGNFVSTTNTGTNPLVADTDGDGLKDGVETNTGTFVDATKTGTNPLKADTDGDGFNDGVEVQLGFNPAAAASTPEAVSSIRTAIEFRFNAAKGVSYRIEGSSDLNTWTTVEATIAGGGIPVARFYSTGNQPIQFYRAKRN